LALVFSVFDSLEDRERADTAMKYNTERDRTLINNTFTMDLSLGEGSRTRLFIVMIMSITK
jgi:hypothetical protein